MESIFCILLVGKASQVALMVTTCLTKQEMKKTQVPSLSREDPLEEAMATHSSILVWKIPWTEEAGGVQFMWLQKSDIS